MLLLRQDITLIIHALVHFVDYFAITTCLLSDQENIQNTHLIVTLHFTHLHLYISITTHVFQGRFLKNISFSSTEPDISTTAALTYTKLYSFIPIYIFQRCFTEGLII